MSSSSESHGTNDLNAAGHEGVTIERLRELIGYTESALYVGPSKADMHTALSELLALRTAKPAEWQGMEDWIRDTAMDVMLATEVEEACRILAAALPPAPTQDISHDK